jgi:hypothetical protein
MRETGRGANAAAPAGRRRRFRKGQAACLRPFNYKGTLYLEPE